MKIYLLPASKMTYQLYSPDFQEVIEKSDALSVTPTQEVENGDSPTIETSSPEKGKARKVIDSIKSGYMKLTRKQRHLDSLLKTIGEGEHISLHYPPILPNQKLKRFNLN